MILVIAAMESEMKDIILHPHPNIKIVRTGVGKVNASYVLSRELSLHSYELIINLGLAGATTPFCPGDFVLIKDAAYHDFDLTMFGYKKGQVPGYPSPFVSDLKWMKKIEQAIQNIKIGSLYTGDRFMTEGITDHMVFDMEGAALYQVAYAYQVPIISLKVISDIVGSTEHLKNYTHFEAEQGSMRLLEIYQQLKGIIV
jgi:adenosylhomocysteine nucleosidase